MKAGTRQGQTPAAKAVSQFLGTLRQRNASAHTLKAYSGDLANFSNYVGSRDWRNIDHLTVRGFLSSLYDRGLSKGSVARALAAVRSLYRWLAQDGVVEQNPAALVSTPKLAKKLPRVPTIEEMNSVLESTSPEAAAFPGRDRLIFELLYGCGIRNSELTGISLGDIRLGDEIILIRGKGKKRTLRSLWRRRQNSPCGLFACEKKSGHCEESKHFGIADQSARRTAHYPQCWPDC